MWWIHNENVKKYGKSHINVSISPMFICALLTAKDDDTSQIISKNNSCYVFVCKFSSTATTFTCVCLLHTEHERTKQKKTINVKISWVVPCPFDNLSSIASVVVVVIRYVKNNNNNKLHSNLESDEKEKQMKRNDCDTKRYVMR